MTTAWTDERERGQPVGIPADRPCATKPQLARQRLARAFGAGVPAQWGTGACVDGHDRRLRLWVEAQPQADVLAVSGQEYGWLEGHQRQVKTILAGVPEDGWRRLRAGAVAQGPRWYEWRWRPLAGRLKSGGRRWLLVRRRVSEPMALTAFVVLGWQTTALEEVVRVAGSRWTIASGVEAAQGEGGLDHDEVRSWTGWDRHLTLARWAWALLTIMRAGTIAVEA